MDARAFTAETVFMFPDESRAMVRSLLRGEFARLEAERMGYQVDPDELDTAVAQSVNGIRAGLAEDQELEDWAQGRYGRNWSQVEAVLRRHLGDNQLYQIVLRADAMAAGRYQFHMLIGADPQQAEQWARRLRKGADPRMLARESMDPGPKGDSSFPPVAVYLPEPLRSKLKSAKAGAVVGPFQFEGDQLWRVVRLESRLPPENRPAPAVVLLEQLRRQAITPLEARTWFEEMVRRYTAQERLPSLLPPAQAFVVPKPE